MSEMIREDVGKGSGDKTPDTDDMTLGDWLSPPPRPATDSAALLAGALEDLALRMRKHEERVQGALGALDTRLDLLEKQSGSDENTSLLRQDIASVAERIGTLGNRVEDISDSLAAVSGDVEDTRRGLERCHEETARLTEKVEAEVPAAGEGTEEIRGAIRELASQVKTARSESTRIGGATEKAVRELGRRGQESAAAQQEATGKIGRAVSVLAARIETIERTEAERASRLAKVEDAIGTADEALDSLSPDGVSPHVAKVEREIAAFNQSAKSHGEAKADVFDRIAARAENAYEAKKKQRGAGEGGLGARAAALGQKAREREEPRAAAPRQAETPPRQPEPHQPEPPRAEAPRPEPLRTEPHRAEPEAKAPPPKDAAPGGAQPEPESFASEDAGMLAVRPGSTAQANRKSRKQREQSFEDAFDDIDDEDAEPPSIASIRQRFRGNEEDVADKGLDLTTAFEDQEPEKTGKAGIVGRVLGMFKRGKGKRDDVDDIGDDEDAFDTLDFDDDDDDDDPYAVFDDPKPAAKAAKGRSAKSKKKIQLSDDGDDLDEFEDDWAEETGRARSVGGVKIALALLLFIAVIAVGFLMMRGGGPIAA